MDESNQRRWRSAVVLLGVGYMVVGVTFAAVPNWISSNQLRTWRLAAWVVSGIAFAAHIVYEQVRLRSSTTTTASHASLAAALGAFGLAAAANVHSLGSGANHQRPLLLVALVAWPVLTAVPAFLVALGAAALLALRRRDVRQR
jgi:hypothetical protein